MLSSDLCKPLTIQKLFNKHPIESMYSSTVKTSEMENKF